MIEPFNARGLPGFFLNRPDHAHEIVAGVGASKPKVQMDLRRGQILVGDAVMRIRRYLPTGAVGLGGMLRDSEN